MNVYLFGLHSYTYLLGQPSSGSVWSVCMPFFLKSGPCGRPSAMLPTLQPSLGYKTRFPSRLLPNQSSNHFASRALVTLSRYGLGTTETSCAGYSCVVNWGNLLMWSSAVQQSRKLWMRSQGSDNAFAGCFFFCGKPGLKRGWHRECLCVNLRESLNFLVRDFYVSRMSSSKMPHTAALVRNLVYNTMLWIYYL